MRDREPHLSADAEAETDRPALTLAELVDGIRNHGFTYSSDDPLERAAEFYSALPENLREPFSDLLHDLAEHWSREGIDYADRVFNALHKRSDLRAIQCDQCRQVVFAKDPRKRFCRDTCRVQWNREQAFK